MSGSSIINHVETSRTGNRDTATRALVTILIPMLLTVLLIRLYLHGIDHHTDVFLFGYHIHHLYTGILLVLPASIYLGLDVRDQKYRNPARIVLGIGHGLILDQVVFLLVTDGSNDAYITPVSLWGAVGAVGLITGGMLFWMIKCR